MKGENVRNLRNVKFYWEEVLKNEPQSCLTYVQVKGILTVFTF
jgi:hypothetical protein